MKIGIYGGSFNPLHYGHIGLAQWVQQHTDLDEVWLMLSPANPLKDATILTHETERMQNLERAIASVHGLRACDIELRLPRPSYTIDTLAFLRTHYPNDEFSLIIGEDNLAIIRQWKDWQNILRNYRIFVYPRLGYHQVPTPALGQIIRLSDAPIFDISSTAIRNGEKESGIPLV